MKITIPLVPRQWQAPNFNKRGGNTRRAYPEYKLSVAQWLLLKIKPEPVPDDADIWVRYVFIIPRPELPQYEPDLDNLQKAASDSLQYSKSILPRQYCWRNDRNIKRVESEKRYAAPGEEPRTEIEYGVIDDVYVTETR